MRSPSCRNAPQIKVSPNPQQHPKIRLQANTWLTAVLASLILTSVLARTTVAQQPAISNTVFVTFSVTDRHGRYVSGLRREYFSVFEKKEPLDVTFFSQDDQPTSIGVLF